MLHGGMLRVAASNEEAEPGRRRVHLVITDTGVGMDAETRRRALEPFFTTRPTAAGLGLATAAGIVEGFGGHIELESEPRMGTTVHLYLPAAEDRPQPAADRQASPAVIGRVLIVEDQPEVAQLVQRLIEPAGYTITVATDALTAVGQVAAGARPDLLITDVVMPSMTGPELAAALRTHRPDLPVLYMSGYTAASIDEQDVVEPGTSFLRKPFALAEMLGKVREVLDATGVAPAGTGADAHQDADQEADQEADSQPPLPA
jgi:CheY-like chemotaxis protein